MLDSTKGVCLFVFKKTLFRGTNWENKRKRESETEIWQGVRKGETATFIRKKNHMIHL